MESGFVPQVVTAIDARKNTITASASMAITEGNDMILWGHEESTMKNDSTQGEVAFQDMSALKDPITVEMLTKELHTSAFKTDAATTYDKESFGVVTNKWLDIQAKEEGWSKSKDNDVFFLEEVQMSSTRTGKSEIGYLMHPIAVRNQMKAPETPCYDDNKIAAASTSMRFSCGHKVIPHDNDDSHVQCSLYTSIVAKEDLEGCHADEKDCFQLEYNQEKNEEFLHANGKGNQISRQECTELHVKEAISNNMELINLSRQLSVLETLQGKKILHWPEKASTTALDGAQAYGTLGENKKSLSAALSIAVSDKKMEGIGMAKPITPFQTCPTELNDGSTLANREEAVMEIMEYTVEVIGTPKKLESPPDKTDSILVELMNEPMSSFSVSVQAGNSKLAEEEQNKPCSKEIGMMNPTKIRGHQIGQEFISYINVNEQEKVDQNNAVQAVNDELILLSSFDNVENTNILPSQDMQDKSYSSADMSSTGQLCRQTLFKSPQIPYSSITSDSEAEEFIIDDGETSNGSFILKHAVEQCESSWYAEETLKGLTFEDVKVISDAEIEDRRSFIHSVVSYDSSESKEFQPEGMKNACLLNSKMISSTNATDKDISTEGISKPSKKNTMMPIFSKEPPPCPIDTQASPENSVYEHDKDLMNEDIAISSEKNHGSPDSEEIYVFDNRVQPLVCFSCPLLNSWNEDGGDEFDFLQAATSQNSIEGKKEDEFPSDSSTDYPKSSTEKSHSQRVRIPLCNLFAEDSILVSDSEEKGTSTEECDPLVKSIPDPGISLTPKNLTNTKVDSQKQKLSSFFRYCICLPAVR